MVRYNCQVTLTIWEKYYMLNKAELIDAECRVVQIKREGRDKIESSEAMNPTEGRQESRANTTSSILLKFGGIYLSVLSEV